MKARERCIFRGKYETSPTHYSVFPEKNKHRFGRVNAGNAFFCNIFGKLSYKTVIFNKIGVKCSFNLSILVL